MSEKRSLWWYRQMAHDAGLDPSSDAVRQTLADMVQDITVGQNMEILGGHFATRLGRLGGPDEHPYDWPVLLHAADQHGYGPCLWIYEEGQL